MLIETTVVFLVVMLFAFVLAFRSFSETFYNKSLKPTILQVSDTELAVESPFKGTPVVEITALETRRFPYVVENVKNWYSTQPLVPSTLGTNVGKRCPGVC
jgi:uncharacterized membrane protein